MTNEESKRFCNIQLLSLWHLRRYSTIVLFTLITLLNSGQNSNSQNEPLDMRIRLSTRVGVALSQMNEAESVDVRVTLNQQPTVINHPDQILSVLGNRKAWAAFDFVQGFIYEHRRMLVQTKPGNSAAQYRFPCSAQGDFYFSWDREDLGQVPNSISQGEEACAGEGLRLVPAGSSLLQDMSASIGFDAMKWLGLHVEQNSMLSQVTGNNLVVSPGRDYTLIEVNTEDNRIDVDVATGNITVQTSRTPQGVLVNAGQRYSYPSGQITPRDCRLVAESPQVQAFLDPARWAVNETALNLREELTAHLRGQQTAAENCPAPPNPTTPIFEQESEAGVITPNDIEATVQWSTADDLDLAVTDPRGQQVSYVQERLPAGSYFSEDENNGCSFAESEPIEEISWSPSSALSGQYVATVNLYPYCPEGIASRTPVPFTLTLSIRGNLQTITGTVSEASPTVTVPFSFP